MTHLRLASAEEGRAILAAEDDFTRALSGFDRSFRMRTTEEASMTDVCRFLGEQAVDFTKEEAAIWESALDAVAQGARGIGRLLPSEVLVVKTTGREERNHAYTRANAIVLPATRVEQFRGERALYLLAHELFHVASRAAPALRDATYALLGFTRTPAIAPPIELDAKRLTNPDAYRLEHFARLGGRDVVPLLTCKTTLGDALGSANVLGAVEVSLLAIDPATGTVVRDAEGAPIVLDPATTKWAQQLNRNTTYSIHPEEVLADNHALLVRRRLGSSATVADPAFLDAFEEAVGQAPSV